MKKSFLVIILLFSITQCFSQTDNITITFNPTLNNKQLVLDTAIYSIDENLTTITNFKFYVSNIELYWDEKLQYQESNSYHLVDINSPSSLNIILNDSKNIKFNIIRFNLGIDSITNVSGAMGGDLDPTNGMYWTWQSGYINFKLEGTNTACPTRKNKFTFHLGGYSSTDNSLQKIWLKTPNTNEIKIKINLDEFFNTIDLKQINSIMIPGKEAVKMSKIVSTLFSINE